MLERKKEQRKGREGRRREGQRMEGREGKGVVSLSVCIDNKYMHI